MLPLVSVLGFISFLIALFIDDAAKGPIWALSGGLAAPVVLSAGVVACVAYLLFRKQDIRRCPWDKP